MLIKKFKKKNEKKKKISKKKFKNVNKKKKKAFRTFIYGGSLPSG